MAAVRWISGKLAICACVSDNSCFRFGKKITFVSFYLENVFLILLPQTLMTFHFTSLWQSVWSCKSDLDKRSKYCIWSWTWYSLLISQLGLLEVGLTSLNYHLHWQYTHCSVEIERGCCQCTLPNLIHWVLSSFTPLVALPVCSVSLQPEYKICLMIDTLQEVQIFKSDMFAFYFKLLLVVEEAGVSGDSHRPWASNW